MELDLQCYFGLSAGAHANAAIKAVAGQGKAPTYGHPHREVFRNVHSLVCHAANVSKLIWPNDPPRRQGEEQTEYKHRCKSDPSVLRGKMLRETFKFPKEIQELRDRRLRNLLEHFDCGIDTWIASVDTDLLVDVCIGNIIYMGVTYARFYNPELGTFTLWNELFDLNKLCAALEAVRKRLEHWAFARISLEDRRIWQAIQEQMNETLDFPLTLSVHMHTPDPPSPSTPRQRKRGGKR